MAIHEARGQEQRNYALTDPYSDEHDSSKKMSALIKKLDDEAQRRVGLRKSIEDRWILDLTQYHGLYDETTRQRLTDTRRSKVFKNRTRPKTNAMTARLFDLLFPTDDRNWGIQPTPVPEMQEQSEEAQALRQDATDTFADRQRRLKEAEGAGREDEANAMAAEMEELESIRTLSQDKADELSETLTEARRRSELMQFEIEDQFKSCRYQAEARDMIEDACKIGMGVIKGPVIGGGSKMRWTKTEDGQHELKSVANDMPRAFWVDPWSFFPSPDVKRVEDSEGFFERHLMNKVRLRKMQNIPDIDKDALRAILNAGPERGGAPSYLVDLRNLTTQNQNSNEDLFAVWEYTGPISKEDFILIADATNDVDAMEIAQEMDELTEEHVRIMFCQGHLLSFGLHPLDSNAPIYSVYNLEKDEASLFGFGIPYLMRDSQSILNAAQRMMMDNSGYSVGPQIVVNKDVVEPEDGDWQFSSMKTWLRKNTETADGGAPFEVYNIPNNQVELANILEMTKQDVDEETHLPPISQGEQGAGVTKTAQGMAMLMNSANVGFRRFVKNFDDDVTVPMVSRFYDWNMQFSEKEEIKGDYDVDARGSSVLLVREMQANNLMMMMQNFGDHPTYGPRMKHEEMLKQLMRAHMIPTDQAVKTEREYQKDIAEQQKQPDPAMELQKMQMQIEQKKLDIAEQELDLQAARAEKEWAARTEIARLDYAKTMQIKVEELNLRAEEMEAGRNDRSEAERIKADSAERRMAAEIGMAQETGRNAGGAV